jgi:hypothetical protein
MQRRLERRWRPVTLVATVTLLVGATTVSAALAQAAPTGSISGVVTAPGGLGIAETSVFATPYDGTPGGASATTEADGRYSLTGLTPGTYRVAFVAPVFGLAFYGDTIDFEKAAPVKVSAGADTPDIDQQYTATGVIRGHVTSASGVALAGASIEVIGTNGLGGASATTGADGGYEATGLAGGTYLVNVSAPAHVSVFFRDALDLNGATAVEVAHGSATSGVDVTLPLAGAISGRVTLPNGEAAVAVVVTATAGDQSGATVSRSDGTYTIDGLTASDYTVYFVDEYYDDVTDPARATPVPVSVGSTTTEINARLGADPSLGGVVRGVRDEPLGGATVTAPSSSGAVSTVITGADGRYLFTRLAYGTYTVAFSAGGYPVGYYADAVVIDKDHRPLDVDGRLHQPASLAGTVTVVGAAALAGANVAVRDPSGVVATTPTDSVGHYEVASLEPGEYTVEFTASGYVGQFYDGAASLDSATKIGLAEGQRRPMIDASLATAVNHAPDAVDDDASAREGLGPTTIAVLANDTEPDGDELHIVSVSATKHGGKVRCSATECRYIAPKNGLIDHDEFSYTISDGALTDEAVVSVRLHPNAESGEGDHGTRRVDMTAVLSGRGDRDKPVKLRYCVRPRTATRTDVVLRCRSATVAPGTNRARLPVWVKGDRHHEGDEYLVVDVTAVGGQLWDSRLTLVIHDDDAR